MNLFSGLHFISFFFLSLFWILTLLSHPVTYTVNIWFSLTIWRHSHIQGCRHKHTQITALLSHEVLVCYQSDFLSQIFISNQSSWLNLKSEPSSINHITCFNPIMPAFIRHTNETPLWAYVCIIVSVYMGACVRVHAVEQGKWMLTELWFDPCNF